jgi:sulfhydrogenase subunit alpha
MTKEITLNHICKIEGHAHLSLKIEKNKVKTCELKAAEGARFFEALVLNKKIDDIQEIVSRICGICSCAHSVAAVQALEQALDIKPSEQQLIIRELLMIGERIRSHITHLYFLSLPDYFNVPSALQLTNKHKEKINDAISLITLGNKIVETFGGREIHPFLAIKEKLPEKNISFIIKQLEDAKPLLIKTIELFKNLKYPEFEREADYLCLRDDKDYATINGKITAVTGLIEDDDYKKHLKENIKEYATSKFVLQDNNPYMLGAMARINKNRDRLDSETKAFFKNIKLPLNNPYHNNIAQAIELLHLVNKAIKLIENFKPKPEKFDFKIKHGHGVSAVEAPRGTLFHDYKIDEFGKIKYCNIITPTAQNLNMMEADIKLLVNYLLKKNTAKNKITNELEKLIRAYDPCFSCSTHFLKVKWL